MFLGKVLGHVVSTQKDSKLVGHKLLIVSRIDSKKQLRENIREDSFIIAVDMIGAGTDEMVIVTENYAASNAVGDSLSPVNAAIIGIVDTVDVV